MRRTWSIFMVLAALCGPMALADWWYTYEADGTFPEQEGFERNTMGGGAQRWFEDGALVLDSTADPGIADFYGKGMESLPDPNDTPHAFVCDWRLQVGSIAGWLDPTLFVTFEGYGDVMLGFQTDRIYSLHEGKYIAYFEPGVFHSYRLVTSDLETYTLAVDGDVSYTGQVSPWAPASVVQFGDNSTMAGSLSRLDYLRYGVLVAPQVGDLNCDGTSDFRDINPFVQALSDHSGYESTYPMCWPSNGDMNGDGTVDFADINPFVDLMLQVH